MATHLRSTLIVSAIQALRARGLYPAYEQSLRSSARAAEIGSLVAGQWIPLDLALEHYRAAERLRLEPASIEAIGAGVAERANKSALSVMVRLSREVGMTPWTALANSQRITDTNWRGSDVLVRKIGPKDATYDWLGQPCAAVPYFVTSFGGYLRALASLFCTKAYTRLCPERCSPTSVSYRLSWV